LKELHKESGCDAEAIAEVVRQMMRECVAENVLL
jgi:chorismate mutase